MGYEPSKSEVYINSALGRTLLSPYYRRYVEGIELQGDEQVLEYGSGSGAASRHLARALSQKDGHLTCVDISQRWIETAKRTLQQYTHVTYKLGKIGDLELEDNTYDVIFIHFVLHDIPTPERPNVVQHLVRVLRPDGRVVLREPTADSHGMRPEAIHDLMVQSGLETIHMETRCILINQDVCDGIFQKRED